MMKRCFSVRCPQRTGSLRSDGESAETADSTASSTAQRGCRPLRNDEARMPNDERK